MKHLRQQCRLNYKKTFSPSYTQWRSGLKFKSHSTGWVQITAPSINYQTSKIPLDLLEHFVKGSGLGDTFNAIHLSVSWWPVLWFTCGKVSCILDPPFVSRTNALLVATLISIGDVILSIAILKYRWIHLQHSDF